MIAFTNTVDIARSPAAVFGYLADLEHTPEWNWAITSTLKVSPGDIRIGTRYRQTRSVPRPSVETLEVTELATDRRIAIVGQLGPFRAHLTYDLSPIGDGTRLTNTVELEPSGLLAPLAGLFARRIQASAAENLETLRRLLQQGLATKRAAA